ncbi:hypothetical protein [Natrinema sp. DC36]|uniref:hypothetical protein n=1 Tax=Natrinema sp. DC36 TaxID=2878680 RepID=UPI001CF0603E|nr:hypothetical protein [Natrinema sp. DC36]
MNQNRNKIVRIATLIETYLAHSVRVGSIGTFLVGSLFLVYVAGAVVVKYFGWLNPPYPVLSLGADPVFLTGATASGLLIVQSTGSLLLYHFLVEVEDERSQFVVLWGFIGLGFGGALLKITLPNVVRLLF